MIVDEQNIGENTQDDSLENAYTEGDQANELHMTSIHASENGIVVNTIEDKERMVLMKESDVLKMKNMLLAYRQDRADKDAFADVTRRLMYFFSGIPTKTAEIKKIIEFITSCFSIKNGKRKFNIIKLGKKIITNDLPMAEIASMGDALNLTAFDGFKPVDYGDAFQRNQIPMIDISPLLEVGKTLFNNEKEEK